MTLCHVVISTKQNNKLIFNSAILTEFVTIDFHALITVEVL